MNRLQKKAWTELIAVAIMMICITIPCLLFMAHTNAHGLVYVITVVLVGAPTAMVTFLFQIKRNELFDEREKAILRRAQSISNCVFVVFLILFSFTAFFLIGGGGKIDVVLLPIMTIVGIFLAQCSMSFVILFQCAKEEQDIEGGIL